MKFNLLAMKLIVFISLVTLIKSELIAQDTTTNIDTWLSKSVDSILTQYHVPGIAMGIVQKGKVIYKKGYGFSNLKTNQPVTTKTIFHTASLTKTFVATAVMQLAEQGKVDLDSSVIKYVPFFKLKDKRYADITVREMLTHSSGLPDVEDYEWDKPQFDDKALERYVKSINVDTLLFAPGSQFSYSNMAYEVLGDLVAKTSHMNFESYVQRYILNPLTMKNSTLFFPDVDTADLASPYILNDSGEVILSTIQPYNRIHAPSSTLYSNVDDMAMWLIANLNRGSLNGKYILNETSYNVLWKPYVSMGTLPSYGDAFVGLSWFQVKPGLHKYVLHSGYDKGYQAFMALAPDNNAGVVLLANLSSYNYDLTKFGLEILDLLVSRNNY